MQDPVVHYNFSPYNAFDNNPVFWADTSGEDSFGANSNLHGFDDFGNSKTHSNGVLYVPLFERGLGRTISSTSGGTKYYGSNGTNGKNTFVGESARSLVVLLQYLIDKDEAEGTDNMSVFLNVLQNLYYEETQNTSVSGVRILMGFTDDDSGLKNFEFFQTVQCNYTKTGNKNSFKPYIDAGKRFPFYLDNDEKSTKNIIIGSEKFDLSKYDLFMYDNPTRPNNIDDLVIWRAELSIIGMDNNGRYVSIATISYGFNLNNRVITKVPIQFNICPSYFHENTINSIKK